MAEETEKQDYNFMEAEPRILRFWEDNNIFRFKPEKNKKLFSIDNPPPTLSGKMHIGHAFQYSQQDFIARFHRMKGESIFFPFGTDNNGLPTEKLVEKLSNVKSKSMSRGDFINLCNKTLKEITPDFIRDWKNLAISSDYSLYYSTIDDNCRKLSQKSFIDLYKKGEVYKKDFPSLWCCECQTAIAQAELEDKELDSLFSTLKFKVDGKELLIATTRPELLEACRAVFINPKDERYKKLIGKKAKVPLFDFEVPIIADESAQMDKGTGVLMVCSYGDKYDAEAITKHKLSPKIIIDRMGMISYKGEKIKAKAARKAILEDLKNAGLIKEQKSIKHTVNVHERCGTEIEIIPSEQWFIKILDKKKKFIEQGRKIEWHPEFMRKRYKNWVEGLQWDWNISRDRHFGIPIPVWQCEKCKKIILAEEKELPIDPTLVKKKCCNQDAIPEIKVFDTWQTSSISPQIIFSLTKEKLHIPTSLRCNAHDIIRTWDFYTIAKSFMHEEEIPWKDLMISGFVTLGGEKMSKSKGNTIQPQEITVKYGADALRYWAASSKLGEDLDYQEKEVITGKKFVTKIWNATKFVFMNLKKQDKPKKIMEMDRLFLTRLNKAIRISTQSFEGYEYARAKAESSDFFFRSLCDNYLEIVKNRVYQGSKDEKQSAEYTLYHSLLSVLKLMAPFTPFITEELYQSYFKNEEKEKSIHLCTWPEEFKIKENKEDDEVWNLLIETLSRIRMEKSKAQKSMKAEIILTLEKDKQKKMSSLIEDLKSVMSIKEIKEGSFGVEFL